MKVLAKKDLKSKIDFINSMDGLKLKSFLITKKLKKLSTK